ncbi:properdin isoform X2 [Xenopus laevis]|uniref:Properdin isoform X2 n=1 Tax=Xenopus laevis TaxID=8355 RepID=A0A8J0THF3_XENLA|nr:properdin isoform X2 [Xenopus laevis]
MAAPFSLLWLLAVGGYVSLLLSVSEGVVCYSDFDERSGGCTQYLGEGVSEGDCCLNIKYSFKRDPGAPCESCRAATWSVWSEWGPCSVSCLEGVESRSRFCTRQEGCKGERIQMRACSYQDCCPPHGAWGSWGPWNDCSASCIKEDSRNVPVQSRLRICNKPTPSSDPPGRLCEGTSEERRDCNSLPTCPVPGSWGAWQLPSPCSVTCGIGLVTEERVCDNPAPRHGGRYCEGAARRDTMCKIGIPCPVNGVWSEWSEWSDCLLLDTRIKCDNKVGAQNRKRRCEGSAHGGDDCGSKYKENRYCYNFKRCRLNGSWSEWSEWGLCTPTCGQSERTRERLCQPVYPNYPNTTVTQTQKTVDVFPWGVPIGRCEELNGQLQRVPEKRECKNVPKC